MQAIIVSVLFFKNSVVEKKLKIDNKKLNA